MNWKETWPDKNLKKGNFTNREVLKPHNFQLHPGHGWQIAHGF